MNENTLTSFFSELEKISEEHIEIPRTRAEKWKGFKGGVRGEAGPAAGAVLGAGLAGATGINPLAGAAAGYGVGAIPEIWHGIKNRIAAGKVRV